MAFDIILAPEAIRDMASFPVQLRGGIYDGIESHLRHTPHHVSKSRIKRLRGLSKPQYRLRLGDVRVYYDIAGNRVEVLAILPKPVTERWLKRHGVSK